MICAEGVRGRDGCISPEGDPRGQFMSANTGKFFFPESGILPTNACTRSQIPGLVGDRGIYWNPGSLPVVQNHPNHYTVPKSGVFTGQQH